MEATNIQSGVSAQAQVGESVVNAIAFDPIYERTREALQFKIAEAIEAGLPLVRARGKRFFSFFELSSRFSDAQKFKCNTCREFWREGVNIAILNEDLTLQYPLLDVLEADANGMAVYGDLIIAARSAALNQPLDLIQEATAPLSREIHGGHQHYHFFVPTTQFKFNSAHNRGVNLKKVELIRANLDLDATLPLKEFFVQIKARVQRPDLIAQLESYVKIVDQHRAITPAQSRLWHVFLQSVTLRKKYSWLFHLEGSVAGKVAKELREWVLSGQKTQVEKLVQQLVDQVDAFTDPEGYKKRVAEASEALFNTAVKFLEDKGWTRALERRMATVDEADKTYWTAPLVAVQAEIIEEAAPALSALQRARLEVKTKEVGPATERAADLIKSLSTTRIPVRMEHISTSQLLKKLETAEEVTLPISKGVANTFHGFQNQAVNRQAYLALSTAAIDGQVYDLFVPQSKQRPDFQYILTTGPVPTEGIYHLIAKDAKDRGIESIHTPERLVVTRVVMSGAHVSVHIPGMELVFKTVLSHGGSLVLGSAVRSEHYGLSRALVQLSEQIPLVVEGDVLNLIPLVKNSLVDITDQNDITIRYAIVVTDVENEDLVKTSTDNKG